MDYSKKCKFFLFTFFPHVTTQQTRTLVEVCKKKKRDPDEENFFSESDDALFRHPSNDKKKEKLVSPSDPREWKRK